MPPLTPGAYLKMRRCAARLSIADVAAKVSTMPRISAHMRAELIEFIEADATPASFDAIVAFNNVYPFDIEVLATLVRISMGADLPMPQICRICAWNADFFDWSRSGVLNGAGLCSICATTVGAAA